MLVAQNAIIVLFAQQPAALLGGALASRFGLAAPFWLGGVTGLVVIAMVWQRFSPRAIEDARKAATHT